MKMFLIAAVAAVLTSGVAGVAVAQPSERLPGEKKAQICARVTEKAAKVQARADSRLAALNERLTKAREAGRDKAETRIERRLARIEEKKAKTSQIFDRIQQRCAEQTGG